MYSIRPRNRQSGTPRYMPEQRTSSTDSSNSSSVSSARTSELSETYILARTDAAPPFYQSGSTVDSSQRHSRDSEMEDYTQPQQPSKLQHNMIQEDMGGLSPPNIAYSPPSPSASMLSVNTYDSRFSECDLNHDFVDTHEGAQLDSKPEGETPHTAEYYAIPKVLRPRPGFDDPSTPSDPYTFGCFFPSMRRLSICHDDTEDGNMNLRVDTLVTSGVRHRPASIQLFHLRMLDLFNRDFSFRRYCRDSGREVCFSKRAYASRNGIQNSVSSALRSVKAPFRRSDTSSASRFSLKSSSSSRRPSSSASSSGGADVLSHSPGSLAVKSPPPPLVPTDTIKLEFSNYARVELSRRGPKRYEFEWWGHTYTWRRSVDKTLNTFSFHLMRDDKSEAVAHVVQEMQSPSQIEMEKQAGGWIPPCYMWITNQSVIEAMTDVADVIIATGLITLVDDCIREEWLSKKTPSDSAPLRQEEARPGTEPSRRGLFKNSGKPFRMGKAIAVY